MDSMIEQAIAATQVNKEQQTVQDTATQATSTATSTNVETQPPTQTTQQVDTGNGQAQIQTATEPIQGASDQPKQFDWNDFNNRYHVASEADLKSLQDKAKLADELKQKNTELEKYKTFNPVGRYFATPEDYKQQQFKIAHPDKNSSIISDIYSGKVETMDDLTAIATQMMFDHPELSDPKIAFALAKDKFGLESDMSDEDLTEKLGSDPLLAAKLKMSGNDAKAYLNKYKTEIEDPQEVDIEALISGQNQEEQARIAKLHEDVVPIANAAAEEIKTLPINIPFDKSTFSYNLKPEDSASVSEWIQDYIMASGEGLTKESMADATEFAINQYFISHRDDIINAIVSQKVSEAKDALNKQYNYPGGLNRDTQPPAPHENGVMSNADAAKRYVQGLGINV